MDGDGRRGIEPPAKHTARVTQTNIKTYKRNYKDNTDRN